MLRVRFLANGELACPIVCVLWLPGQRPMTVRHGRDDMTIEQAHQLDYEPWLGDAERFIPVTPIYRVQLNGQTWHPQKVLRFAGRHRTDVAHYRLIFD